MVIIIQLNRNDVIISNAGFMQLVHEQLKKQIALSAAANTGDYLHPIIVAIIDQLLKIKISLYSHRTPILPLCHL